MKQKTKDLNLSIMRKLVLLFVLTFVFTSCEENETIEVQPAKVIGEWQMYRNENLESIIDQWTGTEWTYVDKWFRTIRNNSQIILEFKEDGTFIDFYADVPVANGTWGQLEDNRYYFDYVQDTANLNEALIQRRYITFYCDNTYTVEIKGDSKTINYYKEIDAIECASAINYKVTD